MKDTTLFLIAGGAIVLYLFTRPKLAATTVAAAPVYPAQGPNPYGGVGGYYPPAGYPRDPGDQNSWAPAVAAGVGALGGIINSAINASNSSTNNGTYQDPTSQAISDGGWSDPFASDPNA